MKTSRTGMAALVLLALSAPLPAAAPAMRTVTLALPHGLASNESASLIVQVGVIPRGAQIDILDRAGNRLGTISPFAIRPGKPAGAYTIPLKSDAIRNGRIAVRLSVRRFGQPPRAPTPDEVQTLKLAFTRVKR